MFEHLVAFINYYISVFFAGLPFSVQMAAWFTHTVAICSFVSAIIATCFDYTLPLMMKLSLWLIN
jgi:hypothetical protein